MRQHLWAWVLVLPSLGFAQSGTLISRTSGADIGQTIEGLLVDYSAASVSAAELAKLGTTPVTVVENVRDISVALQGDTPLSKKVFGLAITPARTPLAFPRISLPEYAGRADDPRRDWKTLPMRLLGATTFGYAQGESEHGGVAFRRKAVSLEASAFFRAADDPVVAVSDRNVVKCALDAIEDAAPQPTAPGPVVLKPSRPEERKKAADAFNDCAAPVLNELDQRWNRSRFSLSWATGWIRRADGSGEQVRLGHTLGFGAIYGFDHVDMNMLKNRAAITLVLRRATSEPVLETLASGPLDRADSTLAALRLSGGSAMFRGLVEVSNARSTSITTNQARMRRALGIDYRVADGLWLGLRTGKQRKVDNSGEEVGSFLTLNYSPSATLRY
jgi:hypothetical protein